MSIEYILGKWWFIKDVISSLSKEQPLTSVADYLGVGNMSGYDFGAPGGAVIFKISSEFNMADVAPLLM